MQEEAWGNIPFFHSFNLSHDVRELTIIYVTTITQYSHFTYLSLWRGTQISYWTLRWTETPKGEKWTLGVLFFGDKGKSGTTFIFNSAQPFLLSGWLTPKIHWKILNPINSFKTRKSKKDAIFAAASFMLGEVRSKKMKLLRLFQSILWKVTMLVRKKEKKRWKEKQSAPLRPSYFEVTKSGTKLGYYDTHLNTHKHPKKYKGDLWFQFGPFQETNGSNPEISNIPIFFFLSHSVILQFITL